MYQGYAFVALFIAIFFELWWGGQLTLLLKIENIPLPISFKLWWGGQLTLLLKIENIPLQETHVFHMLACSF